MFKVFLIAFFVCGLFRKFLLYDHFESFIETIEFFTQSPVFLYRLVNSDRPESTWILHRSNRL